jgi:hypothetical protein
METKPDDAESIGAKVKWLCCHPMAGLGVGLIGIILAIYFYIDSLAKPKLILVMHPIRSPIVQAGRLTELSVSFGGKPISGDLTFAQFALWNAGKAPVRHEDILKPIILCTVSNRPIYQATIRNVSRDVVGFQLDTNMLASGRLGLDWRILEHNDGASIQVLYGGDQKLVFVEEGGVVVGQNHIPLQPSLAVKRDVSVTPLTLIGSIASALLALVASSAKKIPPAEFKKSIGGRLLEMIVKDRYGGPLIFPYAAMAALMGVLSLLSFVRNFYPPFDF